MDSAVPEPRLSASGTAPALRGGATAAPSRDEQPYTATLVFTGSGSEYFRIWIVNLLLSLLTLGIYSAWAKVRKASYFRCNTRLDGHVFGYHGDPRAILRGRVTALALLTGYSWAFAFSRIAGLCMMGLLCAVGPWLFMKGQQFAFANTSFRGLRFGFRAEPTRAYRSLLPVLALWWGPGLPRLTGMDLQWWATLLVVPLSFPWMHHQLKAYQHDNALYGRHRFSFRPARAAFYLAYAKGTGLLLIALVLLGIAVALAGLWMRGSTAPAAIFGWILAAAAGLVFYLVLWPYYAARLQQVIWQHTQLGGVRFHMTMEPGALFKLALKNTLLTIASCGLYWPWAAVALARYRLECMRVEAEHPLSVLAGTANALPVSATGDGSLDAFGLDIGL